LNGKVGGLPGPEILNTFHYFFIIDPQLLNPFSHFSTFLPSGLVVPRILLSASISQHGCGHKVSPAFGQDGSDDLQI
jgi:hypothetical protein